MSDHLTPELEAILQQSYTRAIADAAGPSRAGITGHVRADGRVDVVATGDSGVAVRALVNAATLRAWAGDLLRLAGDALRIQRRLRGECSWIAWPDPAAPDGVYFVEHAGVLRRFCPVRIRRPRDCRSCGAVVVAHAVMWREQDPRPWADPNWREVRICKGCVTAPLPGEAPPG